MRKKAAVTVLVAVVFCVENLYICKQKKKVLDLRAEMFYKHFSLLGV